MNQEKIDIGDQELSALFEEADFPTVVRQKKRKGRFSGPLLDQFLRSGKKCVRVRIEELCPTRTPPSVATVLTTFCRNHPELCVDVIKADDKVYLIRTSDEPVDTKWDE
jgi:hypothetical protein